MKTYVEGFSSVEKIQWKFWVKLFFIQIQFSPFPLTDTDKVFGCSQGGRSNPPINASFWCFVIFALPL